MAASCSGSAALCTFAEMATTAGSTPRRKKLHEPFRRLRSKYRVLLIDDSTFKERFSMRLSGLNVLIVLAVTLALYGGLITLLIARTPLKRYIPGYPDEGIRQQALRSAVLADSLGEALALRDHYIATLRGVLSGELPADSATLLRPVTFKPGVEDLVAGRSDSLLRAIVDRETAYEPGDARGSADRRELSGVLFFPPLRGVVTSTFDPGEGHYGIDIVTKADEAVKACLDGTVVLAAWTTDAGHVIQIQHRHDLISVYKHNSVVLRKVGDRVKAGEAIAIVGDSGELTSGPHLHFELWLGGAPIDPQTYMVFQ